MIEKDAGESASAALALGLDIQETAMEILTRIFHSGSARSHPPKMRRSHLLAAMSMMLLASAPAWPQSHQRKFGPYVIRSSTVSTENLSAESAKKDGIDRSPRKAVLNVTVLKRMAGDEETVPAHVEANVRNLSEQRRRIDMREVIGEGRVSYMGTYDFIHGAVLDFTITARPENSGKTFTMAYRERMWAQGDLPDVPPHR